MDADQHERLLTRNEVVAVVNAELGVPLTTSRLDKDCMSGVAPQPAAYYGRRRLYRCADVIAYAKRLLTAEPVRLKGSRQGRLDVDSDRGDSADAA